VSTTRVVLAALPPLLRDIVRATLNRDPDIQVVTEIDHADAAGVAIDRADAHVAIVGVAPNEWTALGTIVRRLLASHAHLTIIALASDARSGYVYRLEPRGIAIDDISPSSLVRAIHARAAEDVHPPVHPLSIRRLIDSANRPARRQ
jgi:DNA-binding NarL/FixJ family response regulator